MRVDFNIPIKDEEVLNERMAELCQPLNTYWKKQNPKDHNASWKTQESGEVQPEFSIKPIAERLSQLLDIPVPIADSLEGLEQEKKLSCWKT